MVTKSIFAIVGFVIALIGYNFYLKSNEVNRLTRQVSELSAEIEQQKRLGQKEIAETKSITPQISIPEDRKPEDRKGSEALALSPEPAQAPSLEDDLLARKSALIKQAQSAVIAKLKDPDSAQFKTIKATDTYVCGEFNSKNAFGGYTGFERFYWSSGKAGLVTSQKGSGLEDVYTTLLNGYWNADCK